jgi:LacI family transcriptional regulator
MATIKDVAELAGVSICTVSNVLNDTRQVRPATKERVEQASRTLRYIPSGVARSLKANTTLTLGMIITTSTNPFYAEVLKGVEQRCYELGYSLVFANTQGDASRLYNSLETLKSKKVDGIILMCTQVDPSEHLVDGDLGVPIVVADWGAPDIQADIIQDNGRHGGYQATRYLIGLGHTRIGVLTGPGGKRTAEERFCGFQEAMKEANLAITQDWVSEGDFELQGGYKATLRLMKNSIDGLPTALFACNDMMAIGALRALHEAGLSVPDDISLMGYDNIQLSNYLVPALSTVEQSKAYLGATAVELLIKRIRDPERALEVISLEPELVVRESTRPFL